MSVICALRIRPVRSRLILACAAVLLAGCQKDERAQMPVVSRTPAPAPRSPAEDAADDAFQAGAGRPATARTLFSTARLLRDQGRTADCEAVLIRTIAQYPDYLPAYCELAELRLRQKRVDDAMAALSTGLKLAPKNAVLLNDLGMCWMLRGDYQRSLQYFTDAAALVPQNARYRSNMAACLGLLGRYEEAYSLYKQILPAEQAQHNLGVLVHARKEFLTRPSIASTPKMLGTATQPAPAGTGAIASAAQTQPAIALSVQTRPANGPALALAPATQPAPEELAKQDVTSDQREDLSDGLAAEMLFAPPEPEEAAPEPATDVIATAFTSGDDAAEDDREDLSDGLAAEMPFATPEPEQQVPQPAAETIEAVSLSNDDAAEDDREDLSDGLAAEMPFATPEPEQQAPQPAAETIEAVSLSNDDAAEDDREDLSDGLAAEMAFASSEPQDVAPEPAGEAAADGSAFSETTGVQQTGREEPLPEPVVAEGAEEHLLPPAIAPASEHQAHSESKPLQLAETTDTQPGSADIRIDATPSEDVTAPPTTPQLVEEQEAFLAIQAASEEGWPDEPTAGREPANETTPAITLVASDSGEGPPAEPATASADRAPTASPEAYALYEIFRALLEPVSEGLSEDTATQPADEEAESDPLEEGTDSPATAPEEEAVSEATMTQGADGIALPVN